VRDRVLKQYLRAEPAVPASPAAEPEPEEEASPLEAVFEPGHRERQTDLPFLLKPSGFWRFWGWSSLPSTALSIASAAMLGLAFLLLLDGVSFFTLPPPLSRSLAVLSAALAWLIAFTCRRRPGGSWPRIWALSLSALTSINTLLSFAFTTSLWYHALVAAGFAAVLTLIPRLFKLRPDSGLLPYIPMLAFPGAFLLTALSFWLLGLKNVAAVLGL
jgi:hypothetical protein